MPPPPSKTDDLHGNAPDECQVALLIIDMINAFDFDGADRMLPHALAVAKAIAALKGRAAAAGVPAIYVNDNFGKWRSDFRGLLEHCLHGNVPGAPIAELLKPGREDYFVLKPKHSGFQYTPLDLLLQHLGARSLILTGVAGNICVLFTANDAYMRGFKLIVPCDCIASSSAENDAYALHHMASVARASTASSTEIDFSEI